MDRRSEFRDAFFVATPSALWKDPPSDKARPKLRSACDSCHAAKVKCTGEPTCARCQSQDLPCSYSYAMRAGKPKGSRNRKTLEKQARLRQEHAARNLHNDWHTTAMDLDTSPWVESGATAEMDIFPMGHPPRLTHQSAYSAVRLDERGASVRDRTEFLNKSAGEWILPCRSIPAGL